MRDAAEVGFVRVEVKPVHRDDFRVARVDERRAGDEHVAGVVELADRPGTQREHGAGPANDLIGCIAVNQYAVDTARRAEDIDLLFRGRAAALGDLHAARVVDAAVVKIEVEIVIAVSERIGQRNAQVQLVVGERDRHLRDALDAAE